MTGLGTLVGYANSEAVSINDNGQAVGFPASPPVAPMTLSSYSNGTMTDLNALLAPGSA